MGKKQLMIEVEPDLAEEFDRALKQTGAKRSAIFRMAMREYIQFVKKIPSPFRGMPTFKYKYSSCPITSSHLPVLFPPNLK